MPRRSGEHSSTGTVASSITGSSPEGAGSTNLGSSWTPWFRAHPRRRGEHLCRACRPPSCAGSSPQARGARPHDAAHDGGAGLIPAGAGSTPRPPSRARTRGAHPRRRGEHLIKLNDHGCDSGSSPQARGARVGRAVVADGRGLIPAGAGSTDSAGELCWRCGAHPRRRGEHSSPRSSADGGEGSSPQARGARDRGWAFARRRGLIPAGAGSTGRPTNEQETLRAHPRRRGEHKLASLQSTQYLGSSPQARGALGGYEPSRGREGLIPAGAGSTSPYLGHLRHSRAHPRRRGEHQLWIARSTDSGGSSPQARGARVVRLAEILTRRLIPAGAGSTVLAHIVRMVLGAHPRRRGEHGSGSGPPEGVVGSSPQARGAHLLTSMFSAGRAGFHSLL